MQAVNWIRMRQEARELSYWLSFVFFDTNDRSLNNRLYLIYLLIFFGVWWFIVLAFFASGGALILESLSPMGPHKAATAILLIVLAVWMIVFSWRSLRRCPVVFSEEDAYLVCQMPLEPQFVVIRWLFMPWLKSLIPFAILGITLGFSLAETGMTPGAMTAERLANYLWQGMQTLLMIIPIHLTLFALIWGAGNWVMRWDRSIKALAITVLGLGGICLVFILGGASSFGFFLPRFLNLLTNGLVYIFVAGFGKGNLGLALMIGWSLSAAAFVVLFYSSKGFSLSRAAQETKEKETVQILTRYGFVEQAREKRIKKRLGIMGQSHWLPDWSGAAALTWKDILQSLRVFSWTDAFDLIFFFSSMMSMIYLSQMSSRLLLVVFWSMRTAKTSSRRFRNDLTRWVLLKQLPLTRQKRILYDLLFSGSVVLFVSLLGLGAGGFASGRFPIAEVICLPGMIASVAGVAAFDVLRKSRSDLLLNGQVPEVSELGMIISAICAGIPVLIYTVVVGLTGIMFSIFASIVIGIVALLLSFDAYRFIDF